METPIEANVVSKKRCQLQIAKAWWEKKHAAINESNSLQEEINLLKVEVEALRNAKDFLWTKNSNLIALNKTITSERDFLLGERDRLKADLDVLKSEINTLKSTNQILLGDSEPLSTALEHNLGVNQDFAPLSKSPESFGGLKRLLMHLAELLFVGTAILAIMSVLLRQTKPIMRLRTIVDSLFKQNIFGIEAAKTVFKRNAGYLFF
jgi:chromosome segregation ATPase